MKQAFAKLDVGGEGAIDAGKVAGQFDAASTPDVISGRSSAEEAQIEFLETFDVGGEIEGMVTLSEFINYYTNIGACVDNDDYFEMMIRTAWHVGGDRQDSSKRVLVTRKDGSQVRYKLYLHTLYLVFSRRVFFWLDISYEYLVFSTKLHFFMDI